MTTGLHLYPLPTDKEITIRLYGFEKDKIVGITIYNLMGMLIDTKDGMGEREVSFSTVQYPAGVYVIRAVQEDRQVSRKFIKE